MIKNYVFQILALSKFTYDFHDLGHRSTTFIAFIFFRLISLSIKIWLVVSLSQLK